MEQIKLGSATRPIFDCFLLDNHNDRTRTSVRTLTRPYQPVRSTCIVVHWFVRALEKYQPPLLYLSIVPPYLRFLSLVCLQCYSLPPSLPRHAAGAGEPPPTSAVGPLPPVNSTSCRASIFPSSKEMLCCAKSACCKHMFSSVS